MTELLDIVNDFDEVINVREFKEAKEEGLRVRTVNIFLGALNDKYKISLSKRSSRQVSKPGRWHVSAGGHVSSGETYQEAAHRETMEESFSDGFSRGVLNIVEIERFKSDDSSRKKFENTCLFYGRHSGPFRFDAEEVSEVSWVDLRELLEWINKRPSEYTQTLSICVPKLINYLDKNGR
jgi:isopentenyl-diphosphate Delta-isomerase